MIVYKGVVPFSDIGSTSPNAYWSW